jgi:hypothetical protein
MYRYTKTDLRPSPPPTLFVPSRVCDLGLPKPIQGLGNLPPSNSRNVSTRQPSTSRGLGLQRQRQRQLLIICFASRCSCSRNLPHLPSVSGLTSFSIQQDDGIISPTLVSQAPRASRGLGRWAFDYDVALQPPTTTPRRQHQRGFYQLKPAHLA